MNKPTTRPALREAAPAFSPETQAILAAVDRVEKLLVPVAPQLVQLPLTNDLVKIGAAGEELPFSATSWDAVLDRASRLMYSAELVGPERPWKQAHLPDGFRCAGYADWRRASRREALAIVDDTRYSPAVDTRFFRFPKAGLIWTDTTDASDLESFAWLVALDDGSGYLNPQSYLGLALAVRGPVAVPGQ